MKTNANASPGESDTQAPSYLGKDTLDPAVYRRNFSALRKRG
jgi:hypothetical protein